LKAHAALSHKAAALLVLAVRVRSDAAAVTAQLHEMATQLDGPVQAALLEVRQLGQLRTDIGEFSPDVKSSSAYAKLASDLQLAQSTAGQLQSSLEGVHQRMQSTAAGLGTLQSDLASLKTAAAATATLAAKAARSTLQDDVTKARSKVLGNVTGLEAQLSSAEAQYVVAKASLAKAVASKKAAVSKAVAREKTAATRAVAHKEAALQKKATDEEAALQKKEAELQKKAAGEEAALQKKEAALQRQAARQVAAARKAVANEEAAVHSAAANGAQQALQSVQASLAESQTQLTMIDSQIESDVAKANEDYARILALNELALLNQLPGGSATGVTTQNGRFVYSIG
jgi:hypothetical protein